MSGAEILYQGMTEIDDDLIEMAQRYHAIGQWQWIRWGSYSICAAMIAAVLLILPMSRVTVENPGVIREEEMAAPKDPQKEAADLSKIIAQTEQGEDILILNHVDTGMTALKIDGQYRSLNDKWSPEAWERMEQEFESMLGIGYAEFQASIFPGETDAWVNKKAYALYTRSAKSDNPEEYQLYHYAFVYEQAEGEGTARIAVSAPWSPLTDYYLDEAVLGEVPEKSMINGAQLSIYEWQNKWFTSFEWQGICYEVETTGLTEEEMVKLIKSLMASGAHRTADVPVDESTYHEARTYSAEIMDLQERISQGMVDRELPFVISSAIRENPDRIVVTVTTQDEALWAELRAYDTTGKLLEIQFAGENGQASKEDRAVLE